MAQMLNLSGFGGSRGTPRLASRSEQPSSFLACIGKADAPEPPLVVEFVGLTDAQKAAAIGGFPGGKRFVLAASQKQAS